MIGICVCANRAPIGRDSLHGLFLFSSYPPLCGGKVYLQLFKTFEMVLLAYFVSKFPALMPFGMQTALLRFVKTVFALPADKQNFQPN